MNRVSCESLMAAKQQKSEDQRAQALRRSGNSPGFGSLSVIGLPKSAFSPGRIRSNSTRSFPGTAVSIIPREAMAKNKGGGGFESEEPTSPEVTCIGKIKSKSGGVSSEKQRRSRPGFDSREVSKRECRAKLPLSGLFGRFFLSGRRKGICAAKSRVEEVKICEANGGFGKERFRMDDPPSNREFGTGPSEINLWKRRFVAKPEPLDLFGNGSRAFGTEKSSTP